MAYSALAIVLVMVQYMGFIVLTGIARVRYSITAPDTHGHPVFDRIFRVQMNTLELLIVVIPGIWLTGLFFDPYWVSPLLGGVFFIARLIYAFSYIKNPRSRGFGMSLSLLCAVLLAVFAAYGAVCEILFR